MQCDPDGFATESHWLGVDPGSTRLGLALADTRLRLALPLGALATQPRTSLAERLRAALAGRRVEAVVVGLPLLLSGAQGAATDSARSIGEQLRQELGVPVYYYDERFSSAQVRANARQLSSRSKLKSGMVDAAAAALILQAYLDSPA